MDWTIHFGTWVIPAFLTVIFYLYGWMSAEYDSWGIARAFHTLLATICTLATWLVWTLFFH